MSEAVFRYAVNRVKGTRTKDARLGWDAAHNLLQGRIEELEADRARLEWLCQLCWHLTGTLWPQNETTEQLRQIFKSDIAMASCDNWREAIDKAMQPLPPCEEA